MTTAGSQIRDELQSFATALLERRGGLVDWPAGAAEGTAIVPDEVAAALELPGEVVPLCSEPGRPGWCVNLAGDFLETAGRVLQLEPRLGDFEVADLYMKRGTLDAAVHRAFAWLNAKVTMADTRMLPVEYHTWWFRAAIASEDRWETRMCVTINAASGAEVDLPDPFQQWGLRPSAHGRPSGGSDLRAGRIAGRSAAARRGRRVLPPHGRAAGGRPPPLARLLRSACCAKRAKRSIAAANRPTRKSWPPTSGRSIWSIAASWPNWRNAMRWKPCLSRWCLSAPRCRYWPSISSCSAGGSGGRIPSTGIRS